MVENNMDQSMLSFVLTHLPDNWDTNVSYTTSYVLRILSRSQNLGEYQFVESIFYGTNISQILRVQNPFQYGRFILRREMLNSSNEVSSKYIQKLPDFNLNTMLSVF